MIDTLYASGTLNQTQGFLAAFLIGGAFGLLLEQAGFGSSRRLSGVFYFRDMVVIKFMFSAMTTAAIGYSILSGLGMVGADNTYQMATVFGANIIGGILFGAGFVMAGWCPGTAAVGLASGKFDAAIFLIGVVGGSILFNELYPLIISLYDWGEAGVLSIHEHIGVSRAVLVFVLAALSVACFFFCEWVENRDSEQSREIRQHRSLKSVWTFVVRTAQRDRALFAIAVVFFGLSFGLALLPSDPPATRSGSRDDRSLLVQIEEAEDHIEPETVARRLVSGDDSLLLVDVRPAEEFRNFHLRGAINIGLPDLLEQLSHHKNSGTIVLYSNGMTHPAQARDVLYRNGYQNAFLLTDGLAGFIDRCLTPISLRDEPVEPALAREIRSWRAYFLSGAVRMQPDQTGPGS